MELFPELLIDGCFVCEVCPLWVVVGVGEVVAEDGLGEEGGECTHDTVAVSLASRSEDNLSQVFRESGSLIIFILVIGSGDVSKEPHESWEVLLEVLWVIFLGLAHFYCSGQVGK